MEEKEEILIMREKFQAILIFYKANLENNMKLMDELEQWKHGSRF